MSLVENWRKIAQLNLSATSPLDNNNARGFGMALASAAADLESACTPRPPKAEWFGTEPGQWDSWAVGNRIGVWRVSRQVGRSLCGCQKCDRETPGRSPLDGVIHSTDMVVPIAREGFPAPVGWSVVGG